MIQGDEVDSDSVSSSQNQASQYDLKKDKKGSAEEKKHPDSGKNKTS